MSNSCCCFVCVNEMDAGIIENCGKFDRIATPGWNTVMCPCESVVGSVSLKIQQLKINCETKTKDNVFVNVEVAVQYKVVETEVINAYYKLTNPYVQIQSYVYDVIRSAMPQMDLDDAFASKDHIAQAVKNQLTTLMSSYGYVIIAALVVDLTPNKHVQDNMNDINASQRLREAAAEKAEAEKILQVKAAEADAESKYLAGVGVAKQRKAIVDGLKETVHGFSSAVEGTGPKDVMDLLLMTQYFDVIRDVGKRKSETNGVTLFLPHGPKSVSVLREDLRGAFTGGRGAQPRDDKKA